MEIKYPVTEIYSPGWTKEENHQVGKLLFTRGYPRCGKSTFCDEWLNKYDGYPKVLICGDDFRLSSYGQEYNNTAEAVHGLTVFAAIRALINTHCVLFDETNTSSFSLRKLFKIDPQAQYITFEMDLEYIMSINNKTSRIPLEVFDRITNNLENVDPEEIRKEFL